jgi:hypothetical protein
MKLIKEQSSHTDAFKIELEPSECAVIVQSFSDNEKYNLGVFTRSFNQQEFLLAILPFSGSNSPKIRNVFQPRFKKLRKGLAIIDVTVDKNSDEDSESEYYRIEVYEALLSGLEVVESPLPPKTEPAASNLDDNTGLLVCPESDDMPDNNDKDY